MAGRENFNILARSAVESLLKKMVLAIPPICSDQRGVIRRITSPSSPGIWQRRF
jgi:hypothetical protein